MGTLRILLPLSIAALAAAQSGPVVTSAASPQIGVTSDSLASVFASNISTLTEIADGPPWPTSLGDMTTVFFTDSANKQQNAQILFISPSQMNIYLPAGFAPGPGTLSFPTTGLPPGVGTAALRNVPVTLQKVAPALFSASGTGSGVAAATAVRITLPTQIQSPVPVFTCETAGACQPAGIDPGVDAPVYLSFYGTGIRGASSLANVTVTIGNVTVQPLYAGPQRQTPGLDQVNVQLPLSLHGAGTVNVTVTVDGVMSNAVQVDIL
ncbi:MAG TPA: hypothetical protein VG456_08315 [Candidatus Sulfopaludibacter sp.]|nr:hypothetical protein [Candidatus Sulfopaludibacter sp.]